MSGWSERITCAFFIAIPLSGCYYNDIGRLPDPSICIGSDLAISAEAQPTGGCGSSNGSISSTATGGTGTYTFSKDGGKTKQVSGSFSNLSGGSYLIIVYDGTLCTDSVEVSVAVSGTDFQAGIKSVSPDSDCLSDNGAVELQATGGTGPYSFKLGTITNSTGVFSSLAGGAYTSVVSDATCSINVAVTIPLQSHTSYANDIAPILTAKCNFSTCHGSGAPRVNLTIYDNVKRNALEIKLRTGNGNMPKAPKPGGSLTSDQIKLIACWVDDGAKNN